eukprot:gb/GEZJ01005386.1/.p1 GENE.gb/GEZJ01005386.1/~~gb/GEZJ01005386.1/.p1  ORF type:complete len:210 (+),score=17.72 gb/GEZJ01005386.1/:142-771(+)
MCIVLVNHIYPCTNLNTKHAKDRELLNPWEDLIYSLLSSLVLIVSNYPMPLTSEHSWIFFSIYTTAIFFSYIISLQQEKISFSTIMDSKKESSSWLDSDDEITPVNYNSSSSKALKMSDEDKITPFDSDEVEKKPKCTGSYILFRSSENSRNQKCHRRQDAAEAFGISSTAKQDRSLPTAGWSKASRQRKIKSPTSSKTDKTDKLGKEE